LISIAQIPRAAIAATAPLRLLTQPLQQKSQSPSIFLRNSRPNFAQYISERPEMTSHDEKPKKVKTTKGN